MQKYTINEKDKIEAKELTESIRKLIKERRTMEAMHKLRKLSDILMNLRKMV